jgi:hypothetical protein
MTWCVEGGATPPEVPTPSESNPQGEATSPWARFASCKGDDGQTRPFQVLSKGLDSPSVLS